MPCNKAVLHDSQQRSGWVPGGSLSGAFWKRDSPKLMIAYQNSHGRRIVGAHEEGKGVIADSVVSVDNTVPLRAGTETKETKCKVGNS